MVRLRYRLIGDPAFQFRLALERFAGPEIDGIHKQVAVQLTTEAKRILEQSLVRPWESGNRSGHRLTGVLTGKHGHKAAIQSRIINRGGPSQAKGVGFPDIAELDRRAAHWRGLEFGWPYMTMPTGLFIQGGTPQPLRARTAGDTFIMYGEFARRARALSVEGTRRAEGPLGPIGQRRTRFEAGRRTRTEGGRGVLHQKGRVEGITGRHFLEDAWNHVAGPQGRNIIDKYESKLREIFGEFTR
jgi:hypothetical protein